MKKPSAFIISFTLIFLLAGCGGGGGSGTSGGTVSTYSGKTTPAPLTVANTPRFLQFFFSGILNEPPTPVAAKVAALAVAGQSTARAGKRLARATAAAVPVSGTINGSVSGSASYSGTVNADETGVVSFHYTAFNNGDGYTYNGSMQLAITAFDLAAQTVTGASIQLNGLSITSAQTTLTMQGNMLLTVTIASLTETLTLNIDGRTGANSEEFRLENLVVRDVSNDLYAPTAGTETISGRIYLGSEGYVDLSQTTPLRYDYLGRFNVDVPNGGGPLILSGAANSRARCTPLSISQVRFEVDSDGDGSFEAASTDSWTKLAGLVFTWKAIYGTTGFDVAYAAVETSDGGSIATGYTNTGTEQRLDVYLVKTDAAGTQLWAKTFGGTGDDSGWSVQQTADGGFIIAGTSSSPTFTGTGPASSGYIIKTDGNGTLVWERRLSDGLANQIFSVLQTADGGYILTGSIESFSPATGVIGYGMDDLYLVRLNGQGSVLWEKRFGGSGTDSGRSVKQTADGGFVVAGGTDSFDFSQKGLQAYLVRTDASGTLVWQGNFGNQYNQSGTDVELAANGDLVVSGSTATLDLANVYYLARVSASGTLLWDRAYGSFNSLAGPSDLVITADGGYMVAGNDSFNVHLIKLDSSGGLVWDRTYNWSNFLTMCTASSVVRTTDGGYLLAGSTWPQSGRDFLLIKTDADGLVR